MTCVKPPNTKDILDSLDLSAIADSVTNDVSANTLYRELTFN